MTKLDESFVKTAIEEHPEAKYYIAALVSEVRRLEELSGRYEAALARIGGMENAPVIARLALRPFHRPSRLGPTIAEQLAASDDEARP